MISLWFFRHRPASWTTVDKRLVPTLPPRGHRRYNVFMLLRFALIAAFVAFGAPARADTHDQEIPTPPEAMLDAAREAEFFANVAIGDRERSAGHVPEAALAYARALHIRKDPVVGGRLGVLLVQAEKYAQAADLLSIALKYAQAPTAEREAFFRAHEIARQHGAWVDVVVSEAGAAVALDGEARNPGKYSAFSIFVVTGEHRLTAVLEEFQDATVPFTVRAGENMRVEIELRSLLRKLEREKKPRTASPEYVSTNIYGDPNYNPKEDPAYEDPRATKPKNATDSRPTHGFVFAGPVVVFGVASWRPAVGGVVGGSWRPNQYFSLGLEGRAAWLTVGVAGAPISAMTAGGLVSVCGHVKWFFGCGLGHVGVVRIEPTSGTFIDRPLTFGKLGGGGRVGVHIGLSRSFSLTGTADVLVLNSGIRVGLEGTVLVDQPRIMLGSQVAAGWEF